MMCMQKIPWLCGYNIRYLDAQVWLLAVFCHRNIGAMKWMQGWCSTAEEKEKAALRRMGGFVNIAHHFAISLCVLK